MIRCTHGVIPDHILKISGLMPRRYFFCGSFVLFMSCVCHAFPSVHVCLLVTYLKRADLLAQSWWRLIVFLSSLSHVVYWVRCGTWLDWFLVFAAFLTPITLLSKQKTNAKNTSNALLQWHTNDHNLKPNYIPYDLIDSYLVVFYVSADIFERPTPWVTPLRYKHMNIISLVLW